MSRPRVSFEFFPPQTLDASFRLWETVRALAPIGPEFVSVTYGAGGTTRQLTHEAVTTIGKNYGLDVAAHLTCVEATRAETMEIVNAYAEAGVTQIVALRGDPPKGHGAFTPHPEGFASSIELIGALARDGRFTIRCGAYPEPHPEARDASADVEWLKRKIDAGASSAITQFFFEAETFLRFRDACADAGIHAPIIPGILPIQSWAGTKRFAERCGTSVPGWVEAAFETAIRDGREETLALAMCTELCDRLLGEGVEDLHFYTLNRPGMTLDVCAALGLAAPGALEAVA
ncbi:methylenetetrahydrofolate reductase [NAD(P)H] [Phaeovulum vinaykumarii]|uniref:Methylenetetrahydrofolate reductase n=1 Tax=Phaeovulum vinaykumarii TaxID=407234 RepID=A0A1N7LUV4_9RHOB|nr:methylenetetrahydrofolate reductase [NAD(P)H] [Phaeovulum vinaykumarii]SIS77616.1 5,10-methylenetetrahydrofolate reductase (NAD(P)) [Phaeovulum vinaykumarii]SOC07365.1 5,10-methylenetetrahydrofolate reductase (NAD(P)) [Phaeovulum vinaykumarii]